MNRRRILGEINCFQRSFGAPKDHSGKSCSLLSLRRGRFAVGLALAGFTAAGLSAAPAPCSESKGPVLQSVAVLYEAGWRGDDEALLQAIEMIEGLDSSEAAAPLARAYYGGACVAKARMVPDRQKPRWLRRGAAELDAAVRAAPGDLQVRLLRAVTFAVLPRLAGRMDTVRDDFNWLVTRAEENEDLPGGCRQAIFYHAGAFAMRERDPRAVELLTRAAEAESAGAIDPERVNRMLRLAQEQLPRENE